MLHKNDELSKVHLCFSTWSLDLAARLRHHGGRGLTVSSSADVFSDDDDDEDNDDGCGGGDDDDEDDALSDKNYI